jgi:hypothetical protein
MHTHQSLWKDGEPLFYDERGYGGGPDLVLLLTVQLGAGKVVDRLDHPAVCGCAI